MSGTEDRLRTLITENLDIDRDPDFDRSFSDIGVSSVDAIAFFKLVNQEFGLGLVANECAQFKNLRELVSYIDAHGQ